MVGMRKQYEASLRPTSPWKRSRARRRSPSWPACSVFTRTRSAAGKRSFSRSCPTSSRIEESGLTRTGRKPRRNYTGRSGSSRSSWTGLKKNRSRSCPEEAGRSGPRTSGDPGHAPMRTLGSGPLDLLLSSGARRAVEPGADTPVGRGVHEASVLRIPEAGRPSAKSRLCGQSQARPGFDAANGARGHLSEASLERSGASAQAVSVSSEGDGGRAAGCGLVLHRLTSKNRPPILRRGILINQVSKNRCSFLLSARRVCCRVRPFIMTPIVASTLSGDLMRSVILAPYMRIKSGDR